METDLRIDKKTVDLSFKRAIYFSICKELFPVMSLRVIGEPVGRHHTSVIYGLSLMDEIKRREDYKGLYLSCRERCFNILKKHDDEEIQEELHRLRIENQELLVTISKIKALCQE